MSTFLIVVIWSGVIVTECVLAFLVWLGSEEDIWALSFFGLIAVVVVPYVVAMWLGQPTVASIVFGFAFVAICLGILGAAFAVALYHPGGVADRGRDDPASRFYDG